MVISKGKTAFFMLIKVDKYTSLCRIGNTQHYQQAMHILFHRKENWKLIVDNWELFTVYGLKSSKEERLTA